MRGVGRRILITGIASFWGGRIAQALESHPDVEVIVGLDSDAPVVALERTEFVRADETYSILARLVTATQVDTVVHAGMIVDSTRGGDRRIHELNTIGTLNLLAAVGAAGSPVRSLIVKSSTLVYGAGPKDPYWFSEKTPRVAPARTRVERSLLEVESYLNAFVEDNRQVRTVTLRFASVLGADIDTPLGRALTLPLAPRIAGFDPQIQFVAQDDVVRALVFAVEQENLSGIFNVAGAGRIPWSEVLALAGKAPFLLPPFATGLALAPLSRIGLGMAPEIIDLLRYGRGVDTRKLLRAGFSYTHSSLSALQEFVEGRRLKAVVGEIVPTYRYEADVEAFFRHSPAVVTPN
ncbi:NAD-dependent epimerase/dehydratase family protein [Acidiferrimicrobium sp. IK]|uniref:NAD-dependent epimerase/dehydratase family protein n=1 Tax=Acidiferrimicrobium sp. IK TaxID=2871700 RepID=UPI0021CB3D4C|nr:NAD-dependent epimerase/dehydratase family protein [Acidiferrimicrobium sp. IK]MCU4187062.1 NAD-dependent epimerase/dehydratase family protein [Acidiferrimicrobium sp. IK]